jgi:uncharacterized membrane protein
VEFWAVFPAAFLASSVEFVEAFTIVLVVGVTISWRSSLAGAAAAVGALTAMVLVFGVALVRFVPIDTLRLVVGILLVLFGLKWLKKAILRYAGLKALHDEEAIYEEQLRKLRARGEAPARKIDPLGFVTSFKSVLLEGLEVVVIVITFGVQTSGAGNRSHGIAIAALGAAAAFVLVTVVGAIARAPLQRVPENTLKFVVGIMLATFGTFWGGEGLGIAWWGEDSFLFVLAASYLALSGLLVLRLRQLAAGGRAGKDRATDAVAELGNRQ